MNEYEYWLYLTLLCSGIVVMPIMLLQKSWLGLLGGLGWMCFLIACSINIGKYLEEVKP